MNRFAVKSSSLVLLGLCWTAGLTAQAPPQNLHQGPGSRTVTPPQPPALPAGKCPVELFRQLLAMTPEQRSDALAARSEASQRMILAKVREYETLPPETRELRLKATELRWYLLPLLSASPTNRAEQLALIPQATRKLVADRLEAWDRLSPAEQQRLRNPAANYLAKEAARTLLPPPLPPLPPDRKLLLEAGVHQWRSLSEQQRDELTNRFVRLFEFTPQEKAKILNVLPEPERQQIQGTLDKFQNLTPPERALCIRNFEKFASLSLQERDQFLRNVEHWKLMSPVERATWIDLVKRLNFLPPLPPGFNAPGAPPMPGGADKSAPNDHGAVGSNR